MREWIETAEWVPLGNSLVCKQNFRALPIYLGQFATYTASRVPGSHHAYAEKVIRQDYGQAFAKILPYRLDMAFQLS